MQNNVFDDGVINTAVGSKYWTVRLSKEAKALQMVYHIQRFSMNARYLPREPTYVTQYKFSTFFGNPWRILRCKICEFNPHSQLDKQVAERIGRITTSLQPAAELGPVMQKVKRLFDEVLRLCGHNEIDLAVCGQLIRGMSVAMVHLDVDQCNRHVISLLEHMQSALEGRLNDLREELEPWKTRVAPAMRSKVEKLQAENTAKPLDHFDQINDQGTVDDREYLLTEADFLEGPLRRTKRFRALFTSMAI